MDPVPNLEHLRSIFETRATPRYPPRSAGWEAEWPYTAVTFHTTRNEYAVDFDLEPGYELVHLRIAKNGAELVDLDLRRVRTVEVEQTRGRVLLRVSFLDDEVLGSLFLQLKPTVSVAWKVGRDR